MSADDGNTITDRFSYSSYGTVTSREGSTDTPFQLNGALGVETDGIGLVYMRNRYYNPRIMRFINADPIGFGGGSNWYAYADNNLISFTDPSGLQVPGPLEMAVGLGPAWGQSTQEYANEVQMVSRMALPIELTALGSYGFGLVGVGGVSFTALAAGGGAGAITNIGIGVFEEGGQMSGREWAPEERSGFLPVSEVCMPDQPEVLSRVLSALRRVDYSAVRAVF